MSTCLLYTSRCVEETAQELGYATVEVAPGETFDGVLPKCVLPDGVTKQVFKEVVGIQVVEKGSDLGSFTKGDYTPTTLDMDSSVVLTDAVVDNEDGSYSLNYQNNSSQPVYIFAFYQYGTGESYKPASTGQSYTINYLDVYKRQELYYN